MRAYRLSTRSLSRLVGVHPDLVNVVKRAIEITPTDFMVVEGLRTLQRQKELVAAGASRTLNSRHLTGHAVDLAPVIGGKLRWDGPLFPPIAQAMLLAAKELEVALDWGGAWTSFVDMPHFQLNRKVYP